jgi:hypothetical protein
MLIGFFFGKDKTGMTFEDRRTVSQLEGLLDKAQVKSSVTSMVVGESSDIHGVKLVNTITVKNKDHGVIAPFLLPSGKFAYASGKFLGTKDFFFYDGKEISSDEFSVLRKEFEDGFHKGIVNYSPGNEGFSMQYKSELAHIEGGGKDLIFNGNKIASNVSDFKEVEGKIAYTTTEGNRVRKLFFEGVEVATSSDAWFDYKIIGGKIVYGDSKMNAIYDGKELPGTFININPRDVGGKLAYSRWLGKESDKSSLFFDGKEYPYDGMMTGNNQIVEVGGKVIFTSFGTPSNFYYDGRKVGSAGRISDLMTVGSTSPIYFYTEDKNKESTIFSIYEIR